jgi:hypothetical protein
MTKTHYGSETKKAPVTPGLFILLMKTRRLARELATTLRTLKIAFRNASYANGCPAGV